VEENRDERGPRSGDRVGRARKSEEGRLPLLVLPLLPRWHNHEQGGKRPSPHILLLETWIKPQ
jgi:hypothetical protein